VVPCSSSRAVTSAPAATSSRVISRSPFHAADRRGRSARAHAHRLQHARETVRLPHPPGADDLAGQGRIRFGTQPRCGRQDDALECGRPASEPAGFQGTHDPAASPASTGASSAHASGEMRTRLRMIVRGREPASA
jgi:hypothetical protein